MLSDYGYNPYAVTVATTQSRIDQRPDYVQRFVKASQEGWYNYLHKDPSLGNALIKQKNPEMGDDELAFAIKAIRELGLVEGGDAGTQGIGAMSGARWTDFYGAMVEAGVLPEGLDVSKAYTLKFVNQGASKP